MIGVRAGLVCGARVGVAAGISADPVAPGGGNFFVILGDSNGVGIGVGDAADPSFAVSTPISAVSFNAHYALGTGPPPTYVDYPAAGALGALSLYAPSNGQSFGVEMTLGTTLLAASPVAPSILKQAVSGSTLGLEWLPGAAPAYYSSLLTYLRSFGGTIKAVVVSLGTNDAASTTTANAFQANMGTFCSQLRTDLGNATLPIVWIKTNAATSPADHPGLATVRAAQVAYVGTDSNTVLVDNDDLALIGDLLHYTADAYLTLGQRCAIAALDKLGVARRTVATTPDVMQFGPTAKGSGNLSVVAPGDVQNGDLLMLGIATGVANTAIATPSGWTKVGTTAQSVVGGTSFCQMALFTRSWNAGDTAAGHAVAASYTAADTENIGQMISIRGPNANPTVDVSANTTPNSFTTGPQSLTGPTTTAGHELLLAWWAGFCGQAGTNALSNGTLSNVAKVLDGAHLLPDTNFQLMSVAKGQLAAAGASGSWSVTSSNNVLGNAIVAGIKP